MSRQQLDRAARDARIEALQKQLATSVSALVSGEDWRQALEFVGKPANAADQREQLGPPVPGGSGMMLDTAGLRPVHATGGQRTSFTRH